MEQTFESRFLADRRAVIAARFQNLNAMQLEGVLTTQGPHRRTRLSRYDYRILIKCDRKCIWSS